MLIASPLRALAEAENELPAGWQDAFTVQLSNDDARSPLVCCGRGTQRPIGPRLQAWLGLVTGALSAGVLAGLYMEINNAGPLIKAGCGARPMNGLMLRRRFLSALGRRLANEPTLCWAGLSIGRHPNGWEFTCSSDPDGLANADFRQDVIIPTADDFAWQRGVGLLGVQYFFTTAHQRLALRRAIAEAASQDDADG